MEISANFSKCLGKGSYGKVYETNRKEYVAKTFECYRDAINEIYFINYINNNKVNNNFLEYYGSKTNEYNDIELHIKRYDFNLNRFKTYIDIKRVKWPLKILSFNIIKSYDNLYQNFLIHGDIKMDNILVCKTSGFLNMIKYKTVLCDFGLTFFHFNKAFKGEFQKEDLHYIQTPNYRAPEIILENLDFNYKIDIWSIGVVMLKLYKSIDFFTGKTQRQQVNNICRFFGLDAVKNYCSKYNLDIELPTINYKPQKTKILESLDNDIKDLLDKILTLDQHERISMSQLFQHKLFKEFSYHFQERDSSKYIINKYKHRIIKTSNIDRNIFKKIYQYLIENEKPVKILFQTILLFDSINNKIDPKYTETQTFITILRIIGHSHLYNCHQKIYQIICKNEQIDKSTTDDLYFDLQLSLKSKINDPCLFDLLVNHHNNKNLTEDLHIWKNLLEQLVNNTYNLETFQNIIS